MYKIYYFDVKQCKYKSFSTIALNVSDAITRLFLTDTYDEPVYKIIKIDRLKF